HREQYHNLQGANAYLGVIVPLAVFGLILPNFTVTTPGPILSSPQAAALALMSIALYATFLVLQTGRHRGYFTMGGETGQHALPLWPEDEWLTLQAVLLVAYMVPVVFLVEHLAKPIDYLTETLGAPAALGGVIMAVLVAPPEAIRALRAALGDPLHRAIHISLCSVLAAHRLSLAAPLRVRRLHRHAPA